MKVEDINTRSRTKPAGNRTGSYCSFDYSDVTKDYFVTKRSTNPLEPNYFHRVDDNKLENIGDIEGSKPKDPPVRKAGPNDLNLDVQDIDGTKSGSRGLRAFKTHTRRDIRPANK